MTDDCKEILRKIPELAYVAIGKRGGVKYVAPLKCVAEGWAGPVISFLSQYASLRKFEGEYFLCLYDGWREYSAPSANPVFVPWREVDSSRYDGIGSFGEPRFVHRFADNIYPLLPLPVLAFCRHVGDVNTLLIPDGEFLQNQFKPECAQVDTHDIDWEEKRGDRLFWRGNRKCAYFPGQTGLHDRDFLTSFTDDVVDARYSVSTPISEFLRHKFLLDADGMVNAWSGLFWKLKSGSLPIKLQSHWEQWYYPLLEDGSNVMMSDRNLKATLTRLRADDDSMYKIAQAGKKLATCLTYDFALEQYIIR